MATERQNKAFINQRASLFEIHLPFFPLRGLELPWSRETLTLSLQDDTGVAAFCGRWSELQRVNSHMMGSISEKDIE